MWATAFPTVFVLVENSCYRCWTLDKRFFIIFSKLTKRCYFCNLVLVHQNCQHPVSVFPKSGISGCHLLLFVICSFVYHLNKSQAVSFLFWIVLFWQVRASYGFLCVIFIVKRSKGILLAVTSFGFGISCVICNHTTSSFFYRYKHIL